MKYIEGFDRKQSILFPQCIDEIIPDDSEVRIIDAFVDALPMEELGFMKHKPLEEGRPMYHSRDLFKLYIYGYLNRIRTSRLLERECERNVELMWLLKGLRPCFRTIAGFRSENPEIFRNTFRYFVAGLNKKSFLGKKVVAIDGTKFRAVNSKKNNYNQKKIERHLNYIDRAISQYMEELDAGDLTEEEHAQASQKITHHRKQRRKYKRLEKALKDSGEDQISTTDPDARSMIIHGSVVEVAYNVQTVVDDQHNLIVEYQPTNRNDKKALLPMSVRTKDLLGVNSISVLADKGYHNGEQLHSCAEENVVTYVSVPDPPRNSPIPTPEYFGENFRYSKKKDFYTCPKGHEMKSTGTWYNRKYQDDVTRVKHYKTAKCRTCPALEQCTSHPRGRVIERSEYADAAEKNTQRVRKHHKVYAARQQIVEHIFGTIKRQWGYDHILLKGLRKNDGEFGLIYFVYNFRRIINILGIEGAKKWIKTLLFSFLSLGSSIGNSTLKTISAILTYTIKSIWNYKKFSESYCTNCRYRQFKQFDK